MKQEIVPATHVSQYDDEINLGELFLNVWRQRGLVVGITLIAVLAALIFHFSKATFAIPNKASYGISLTFNDKGTYPNGSVFSPNDLIANQVIKNTLETLEIESSVERIRRALSVSYSNDLLEKSENKLSQMLSNAKNPADVIQAANEAISDLRSQSRSFLTVSLDLKQANLTADTGRTLLTELVDTWAKTSIDKGLTTADISRPFSEFKVAEKSNLIDNFEDAASYLSALKAASDQLAKQDGVNTLIVNGKTLQDMRRNLASIENNDIIPLRAYAYSNSIYLADKDPLIKIRLDSRERLLKLEHKRLTQQLAVHNKVLDDLSSQKLDRNALGNTSMRTSETAMDESLLNSMIDLGSKLSNVELREMLITEILKLNDQLLNLEKEIEILLGANEKNGNRKPVQILTEAINKVAEDLNIYTKQLNSFLMDYSMQVMQNTGRLYISETGISVSGGGLQISKKIALHTALALVLGGMLGLLIALLRSAFLNNRKDVKAS